MGNPIQFDYSLTILIFFFSLGIFALVAYSVIRFLKRKAMNDKELLIQKMDELFRFDSCVGTNAEPEKITVYNKGRSAVFVRGTEKYETLKGNIYKMLNEKSTNNILMLAIVNGDISEFKQQLNVEFLYSIPAEFTYPSGSKQRITKFIIVPAAQSHTVITAPSDKGLYASGLFMVRMDSSYEELLLKYAP